MITLKKKDGAYTVGIHGEEHPFNTLAGAIGFLKTYYEEKKK